MIEKRNYDVYLEKMEKAMQDKLFFLDHIDINSYDYVLDFGCADGELLSRIDIPNSKKIGYDISEEMIERFKNKLPNSIIFSESEFEDLIDFLREHEEKKILLILSSVLHEIKFSQFEVFIIAKFFANTIVIRDMIEPEIYSIPFFNSIVDRIIKESNPIIAQKWLKEREEIKTMGQLSEYLLKMDYVENYDLEINEYYFGGHIEILQEFFSQKEYGNFKTIYEEDFTIPPMIEKQDKYGLPHFRTHKKLIMMKGD